MHCCAHVVFNFLNQVGLHAEYLYARSLARFSASLGPTAWEITSKRIEKALPAGVKFGRGWVGEFEPLRTTVLSFENHKQQQLGLNPSIQFKLASRKDKTYSPPSNVGINQIQITKWNDIQRRNSTLCQQNIIDLSGVLGCEWRDVEWSIECVVERGVNRVVDASDTGH